MVLPSVQNKILRIILLIVCLLTPSQAFSSGLHTISSCWIKLTTPISSFYYKSEPTLGMPFVIFNKKNKAVVTCGVVGSLHHFPSLVDEFTPHNNLLFKISTLGNKESQQNLTEAYVGGRYFLPYSVFTYDIFFNDSYYWARHSDACSVLLYGYSWLINIPAKILNEIDALLSIDRTKKYGSGDAQIVALSKHKFGCFIDIIINICSLVVEIPIAIANTVVGAAIAFVCHPLNSICSILGFIYFGIISTILAVWDIVADIFLIPYHFIF